MFSVLESARWANCCPKDKVKIPTPFPKQTNSSETELDTPFHQEKTFSQPPSFLGLPFRCFLMLAELPWRLWAGVNKAELCCAHLGSPFSKIPGNFGSIPHPTQEFGAGAAPMSGNPTIPGFVPFFPHFYVQKASGRWCQNPRTFKKAGHNRFPESHIQINNAHRNTTQEM